MRKLANILCVLMTLAVAGTASAALRVVIDEYGQRNYVYDPFISPGTEIVYPVQKECKKSDERISSILDEFKYDAARQGMSVEDYVVDKLKKIQ